ncbi:DUF3307 domain-containing protein [Peteryoungia desertarenae]|uniref:DUF3307 domain-containing protein n=1 Tax=Peteryoungia desertarenae TaxID=1813451 RepID=UPI001FE54AC9|nr:DUF3307 domain-containing protein [Peteryoungia desertarenae]
MTEVSASHLTTLCVLIFILKQLLGDFFLQTRWMASGKESKTDWLLPLAAHAAIHAALTLSICLIFAPHLAWLAIVDFIVHFVIDRAKAVTKISYGLTADRRAYWWLFGTDQTLHHLTHLAFAATIAASLGKTVS